MCGPVFGYKHFSTSVHAFQKRILKPRFQVTGICNKALMLSKSSPSSLDYWYVLKL